MKYRAIWQTTKLIYNKEGARAFYKGVIPNLFIFMPSTALTWGTYELIKGLLGADSHKLPQSE